MLMAEGAGTAPIMEILFLSQTQHLQWRFSFSFFFSNPNTNHGDSGLPFLSDRANHHVGE
jgi:hypothetical protein